MKPAANGFQLVEVIVAASVLFLMSFFLLNLLPTSQLAISKAERRLTAESIAYSLLEELRVAPFSSLITGAQQFEPERNGNVTFLRMVEITEIEGTDPNLVKQVNARVTWEEQGISGSVEASTYISSVKRQ